MSDRVDEFVQFRQRMNERILEQDNQVVRRFFALDTQTYKDGALPTKTKELLGLVASLRHQRRADRDDDREPPERLRLEAHARLRAAAPRPAARRVHRRLARRVAMKKARRSGPLHRVASVSRG